MSALLYIAAVWLALAILIALLVVGANYSKRIRGWLFGPANGVVSLSSAQAQRAANENTPLKQTAEGP